MRQDSYILRAENGEHGLDIYIGISGREHYMTTRRPNGLLWQKLRGGVTIGELRRIKPKYNRTAQKYFHYSRYLLKIADDEYVKETNMVINPPKK